jgi:hypothetical protein
MCDYRCYFINTAGHIGGVEEIECANDREAAQRALRLLAKQHKYDAIEVWDRDRLVSHQP